MTNKIKALRLGDMISHVVDNRGRNPSHYSDTGYYVLDNNVMDGSRYPDPEKVDRFIDDDIYNNFLRKYLEKNDVCISLVGTIGNICMVPSNSWIIIQNLIGLRANEDNSSTYLYYYLCLIKKSLSALNRGSSQPSMLQGDLLSLKLNVFESKEYQEKVAGVLSALDNKIELNNKINADLEKMTKLIYDYWFTQFDFPDSNGKPYKSAGGAMAYSEQLKRKIPTSWVVKKLNDLFEFDKGTEPGASAYSETFTGEGSIKFYRVGDIESDSKTYVDSGSYTLKMVLPGDVVVTFDGTIGKMGITLDGAISGGLRHIYDKTGLISSASIWAIFADPRIQASIHKYATGSVLLHASSSIDNLTMAYNIDVLKPFQDTVQPIYDHIVLNNNESTELAELRDWLLPMLMNGQVKVTNGVIK